MTQSPEQPDKGTTNPPISVKKSLKKSIEPIAEINPT